MWQRLLRKGKIEDLSEDLVFKLKFKWKESSSQKMGVGAGGLSQEEAPARKHPKETFKKLCEFQERDKISVWSLWLL